MNFIHTKKAAVTLTRYLPQSHHQINLNKKVNLSLLTHPLNTLIQYMRRFGGYRHGSNEMKSCLHYHYR